MILEDVDVIIEAMYREYVKGNNRITYNDIKKELNWKEDRFRRALTYIFDDGSFVEGAFVIGDEVFVVIKLKPYAISLVERKEEMDFVEEILDKQSEVENE